tara:strand:+ start:2583 stop:3032 length:450 start_codon:yes stop_codon:yes gene_type:complete
MANILIVEDTVDLGDLLYVFITGAGHRVTLCREALLALDKLHDENFDLIITDMFMPGRDGLDVLREARRASPDTPVLVMSGGSRLFPSFDPLSCARRLGAVGVLAKPFRRSDLLSSINAALGTVRPDAPAPSTRPAGPADRSLTRQLSS